MIKKLHSKTNIDTYNHAIPDNKFVHALKNISLSLVEY